MTKLSSGTITTDNAPKGHFLTATGVVTSPLYRTHNTTTGEQHDFYTLSAATWYLEMQHAIDESRRNRIGQ